MSPIESPPRGFGAAIAVSRAPAGDRRRTIVGTIVGYAAIVLVFSLARGFWWPAVVIAAACAGVTIFAVQSGALSAGDDWLKTSGGRWVDTAHLKQLRLRRAPTATFLELADAADRRIDVRLEELVRTPRLWIAFYAALSRSLDNGLALDDSTGAQLRAANARVIGPSR